MVGGPYISPRFVAKNSAMLQTIELPVLFLLPLYWSCLLVYRVFSLLRIGMLNCGCLKKLKQKLLILMKKEITLENSFSMTNECSPLLN